MVVSRDILALPGVDEEGVRIGLTPVSEDAIEIEGVLNRGIEEGMRPLSSVSIDGNTKSASLLSCSTWDQAISLRPLPLPGINMWVNSAEVVDGEDIFLDEVLKRGLVVV